MKKLRLSSQSLVCLVLVWAYGCTVKDPNVDPNRITESVITIQSRVSTIEYFLAEALAGDGLFSIANTQGNVIYVQGNVPLNEYVYSPIDPAKSSLWNGLYYNVIYNCKVLAEKSGNATHHKALSYVLQDIALAQATSVWGDVPNSQAGQIGLYPNPAHDEQETVYVEIQRLLDEAILLMGQPASPTLGA